MHFNIIIPKNNTEERKYIIHILFKEFLQADYSLSVSENTYYTIELPNERKIIFEDAFFKNFDAPLSYLSELNIPGKIEFSENQFTPERDIPLIFGTDKCEISEEKIICGIDIFASSFFMLSRWEEHVISEKDTHDRVNDDSQYSVKFKIHYRPIVNEYVEMLRNMIGFLGIEIAQGHHYRPFITHDVDYFARYDSLKKKFKAVFGDIIKRKSIKRAFSTIKDLHNIKKALKNDPYNTFDYLMNLSESIGLKSIFYFIPSMLGEPDAQYNINDERVVETINNIQKRGHIVGNHGAYRSYVDEDLFKKEMNRFPKDLKFEESRQHFLRFKNPDTWQMLENAGIETDSTMGFMNDAGFRSGTCFEYSVFNLQTRQRLNLKERPLIIMEQALFKKYPDSKEFFQSFIHFKNIVQKYSGNFVILWHNNNFNVYEWEKFKPVYEKVIEHIYEEN